MVYINIESLVNKKFLKEKNNYLSLSLLILFSPLLIFILIPILIIKMIFFNKKLDLKRNYDPTKEILEIPEDIIDKDNRKYDMVLFGITGFTGKLCYDYLIKHYKNLNFAVSGRNKKKVDDLLKNYEIKKDVLICDISNYDQLKNIIKNTKVVLTTAGPFYQYGNPIVNLCSAYGTDYCDITGEVYFLKENICKYDNLANKTGARIVSFCGADCIPYDISTFMINNKIKENDKDDKIKLIKQFNFAKSTFSGGSMQTIINTLDMKKSKILYKSNIYPLSKLIGKDEVSKNKCKDNLTKTIKYFKEIKKFCCFYPLGLANQKIVERSNNLLSYNKNIIYEESIVQKSFINSIEFFLKLFYSFFLLKIEFIRNFLFKLNLLPKQGNGENIEYLESCYYDLLTIGISEKNKVYYSILNYNSDPGYILTAQILIESGLTFLFNKDEINKEGGIHTTASCFGETIMKRLTSKDIKYKIFN